MADDNIKERISKDIDLFYENLPKAKGSGDARVSKVVELSEMYASDSKSFLQKGDLYTAFASINYAHGLLDAVMEITK